MSFPIIGVVLAASLSVIAFAHLLPAVIALSVGQPGQAVIFLMTGLLTAFIAGALAFSVRGQGHRPSAAERILALSTIWLVTPAFAAIAFVGIDPEVLYMDAYFDAVSALTTTGAVATNPSFASIEEAAPLTIWRATLQWIGGYASVMTAMLVLAQLGLAGLSLRRAPIPPGMTSGPFGRYWPAMLALGVAYGGITLMGLVGLLISGMPLVPAIALSFSAVATGGLMPESSFALAAIGPFPALVICLLLIAGGTNFLRHAGMSRRTIASYLDDPEVRYLLLGIAAGGIVLATVIALFSGGGLSVLDAMMWMASLLSTSVVPVTEEGFRQIPLLVALAVVFVGGSTMSTAGGLKLMRISLLIKQGSREISRLSHPHGIVHTEFGGRPFSIPIMRGVWAMFVMMLVAAVLTTLGLTLYGVSFEMAIAASIAALSNAGPVLGFAPDAAGNVLGLDMMQAYAAMAPGAKLVLAIAMIAGRIEVLAAAAVLAALRTTDSA